MQEFKDKILLTIKHIAKAILAPIIKLVLPIALIAVMVLILLASIVKFLKVETASNKEGSNKSASYVVEQKVFNAINGTDGVGGLVPIPSDNGYKLGFIEVDENNNQIEKSIDNKVDEIIKILKENGSEFDKYLSNENMKEYLKNFIKAEIITQYPDLRDEEHIGTSTESDELQGCIKVEREGQNGIKTLTFMDYNTFNSYVTNNDYTSIENHFSLDESGNLIVAGWTSTKINEENEQVSVVTRNIDYKSLLKNYSMPFDFLWALTVMGGSEDFAHEVAKLALNSDITITAFDNYTETITTETSTYNYSKVKTIQVEVVDKTVKDTRTESKSQSSEGTSTNTTEIKSSSVTLDVTNADTWIANYLNLYEQNQTQNNNSYTSEPEEEESSNTYQLPNPEADPDFVSLKDSIMANYSDTAIGRIKSAIITDSTKISSITVDTTTNSNTYAKGVSEVVEKTDKDSEEPNFVTLFNRYKDAKNNILGAPGWLYESMETSEKTADMVDLVKYLFYKATGTDYGVTTLNLNRFKPSNFKAYSGGGISPFGCPITKDKFVETAKEYGVYNIANYAESFYDVCMEYNVNPVLAYAWAIVESGGGADGNTPGNNLFGYGIYNGENSGKIYNSYEESIRDFAKWIADSATPGTNTYVGTSARGSEFATVNSRFSGHPESNIYDTLSTYAYLGSIHYCDEPNNFNNPAGETYYLSHGSTWGAGGRVFIYLMYEYGAEYGLYDGEYATRCGHANASDATTLEEQSDYVIYIVNKRIKIAKSIFGDNCFIGAGGPILQTAYDVGDYFRNIGDIHYAGDSVYSVGDPRRNGRSCIFDSIEKSWDAPVENPQKYGIVCATYVSFVLWKADLCSIDEINSVGYNGVYGVSSLLERKGWEKITNYDDLQEGDIYVIAGDHIAIYVGDGKYIDQSYCVKSSSGDDTRGNLASANRYKFSYAYRPPTQ